MVNQAFRTQNNPQNTTVGTSLKSLAAANPASPKSSSHAPVVSKSNLGDIQPAHELIENGYNQSELCKNLLYNNKYKNLIQKKDLSGIVRISGGII